MPLPPVQVVESKIQVAQCAPGREVPDVDLATQQIPMP